MNSQKLITWSIIAAAGIIVLLVAFWMSTYVVDARKYAVLVQFGQPVAEQREAGLYFKVPLIQEVRELPRTRQYWGVGPEGSLRDAQTKKGKKINVTPWAVWRITDPKQFLQQFRSIDNGEARIAEVVRASMRDVMTRYDLRELIRSTERELTFTIGVETLSDAEREKIEQQLEETGDEMEGPVKVGREEVLREMLALAQKRLDYSIRKQQPNGDQTQPASGPVIELLDIGISRIEFAPQVQTALFNRQRARMEAISALYENEGSKENRRIINEAKAEAERIIGEGMKEAQEIRGQMRAYEIEQDAKALKEMGEFYFFVRKLEAYKVGLRQNARLVLTTDNEFLDLLRGLPPVDAQEGSPTSPQTADDVPSGPMPETAPEAAGATTPTASPAAGSPTAAAGTGG